MSRLHDIIDKIIDKLDNKKIKTLTFKQDNVTVSANSTADVVLDVSESGWTPQTALPHMNNATSSGTGVSYCYIYYQWLNPTAATISTKVKNTRNSDCKISVEYRVLYTKSGFSD